MTACLASDILIVSFSHSYPNSSMLFPPHHRLDFHSILWAARIAPLRGIERGDPGGVMLCNAPAYHLERAIQEPVLLGERLAEHGER